jgi:hypothetical protein
VLESYEVEEEINEEGWLCLVEVNFSFIRFSNLFGGLTACVVEETLV